MSVGKMQAQLRNYEVLGVGAPWPHMELFLSWVSVDILLNFSELCIGTASALSKLSP